ncbi:MAG: metal ABC transporter permease [Phycisphaeraceae bacterium]|nr:metal ABC transporter permease [Phycisphaeraceae bacterium]
MPTLTWMTTLTTTLPTLTLLPTSWSFPVPTLLEPFQYTFMQHGLIAAVIVGITCAVLGTYVVLRQMAFIGDALSHTALPGLVIAHLNGWSLFLGALITDLLTALGISLVARRRDVREDTAIGILFTGMFALGILIISTTRSFRDLTHMLFGNILGVTRLDVVLMALVAALVLATLAALHKELELTSFDPGYAQVIGLRPSLMRLALLFLLALTVVSGIQVVGVVLTSALLITPAATASLVTKRLLSMMAVATVIAVGCGIAGLYASYFLNVSSGAAIVLSCTAVFILVYLGKFLLTRRPVQLQ